jgi:hypothetical protein
MKAFAIVLLLSGAALADRLEYVGRDKDTGAAQVEHAQGKQSVQVGDDIPGWGRVKSVDDTALHVVRQLTDAEREARKAKGQMPVNAELMIVPRRDTHTVPIAP